MPKPPKAKASEPKKPSGKMNWRNYAVLAVMLVLVVLVVGHMALIQLVQGDDWLSRARSQQMSDSVVAAKRGTIYDANMEPLAISADVWRLIMSPKDISEVKPARMPEGVTTTEGLRAFIADGLAELLGVDREKLFKQTGKTNSQYEVVKSKVEYDQKEAFSKWVTENKLTGVFSIIPDYKRYYPQGTLLSHVLGFTGTDNNGLEGLEASYDEVLSGVPGRIVTAQNGWGDEMPSQMEYSKVVDAQDGNNLVLTINQTVQMYAEKYLAEAVKETNSTNRGCILIQNVKTGGILAMATKGDYDPNNPFVLADEQKVKEIEALPEEERAAAKTTALQQQWKNKAVSETYEPGSVFKVFTAAAGLEEGVATAATSFNCPGYYKVGGWTIRCHKHGGHGTLDMAGAVSNSCNPYFMQLGMKMGAHVFFKYFTAFGFTEKTGIDMSGETSNAGLYHSEKTLSETASSLATAAFGQTNKVTPIQMITGISAIANGGKLMTPYVVQQILDSDGNVVKNTEPTVRRQVVSAETAAQVSGMMEAAVNGGGCKSAYVAGYRVAGKTGTSEKRDMEGNEVVASFAGFAPADDPQIAILVLLDQPQCAVRYGGTISAPVAQKVLSEVLPYLGVEPKYTNAELAKLSTTSPAVTGKSTASAQATITNAGLSARVVGSGATVIKQVPEAGQSMPRGGMVVLYTDDSVADKTVTVPNFSGMSVTAANAAAANVGINLRLSGVGLDSGQAIASKQSVAAGTKVPLGTTVTVSFLYKDSADGG